MYDTQFRIIGIEIEFYSSLSIQEIIHNAFTFIAVKQSAKKKRFPGDSSFMVHIDDVDV